MFEEMDEDISSFMKILSSKGIRHNPKQSNGPYEYIKGSASQKLMYLYIIKFLACYNSEYTFDITNDFVKTFNINFYYKHKKSFRCPIKKIVNLLNSTEAAKKLNIEFTFEEVRKLFLLNTTNGKSDGKAEYILALLPINGGYSGNNGKGDAYLIWNNKKLHIEFKCSQSLNAASASIVIDKNDINLDIENDIIFRITEICDDFSKRYPSLENAVKNLYPPDIKFMITCNKQFYKSCTFHDSEGNIKVEIVDDIFKKLGSLSNLLPAEEKNSAICFINRQATSFAHDYITDIYPSKIAKKDEQFMALLKNVAEKWVNWSYSCEQKNDTLWKDSRIEKNYKVGRAYYNQYNTPQWEHEMNACFVYRYQQKQGDSTIITIYLPTEHDLEKADDLMMTLHPDLNFLKEYTGESAFISADIHNIDNPVNNQRYGGRFVFRAGHPDD